jgi:gamma-glutamyltranspeptidase / glutathione hydrolase
MQGAIAAGHPLTAEAGARVLESGGNGVDACIAAAFAAFVTEGPLTGPAGGGFLLVHAGGRSTLIDCFFAAPAEPFGEIEHVTVDFGSTTQSYHIGDGSVAVPGLIAGLREAHRRWGRLPWAELVEPSIELARAGVDVSEAQAFLHEILAAVLLRDDGGRRIYGNPQRLDTSGAEPLLQALRDDPEAAVRDLVPELADDLDAYEPIEREPLRGTFLGRDVLATPAPSRGGPIVEAALAGFEEARTLHERACALRLAYAAAPAAAAGTTHISVVDADRNAAALTVSTGAGSGVVVPGTGIHLNNMLGEFDLPRPPIPGRRLSSMMSPSVVLGERGPRLVAGSAGSLRLRGAVLQIVVNVVGHGLNVHEAIERPRVHLEEPFLHCEGGADAQELDRLEAMGYALTRWRRRNLFFGGVSAVEMLPDGTLAAAGDPRRGGAGVVVPA